MAYLPVNARSELVLPRNPGGETALAVTFKLPTASPAFIRPALRPMRGSATGAGVGVGELEQPTMTESTASAAQLRTGDIIRSPLMGRTGKDELCANYRSPSS